MVLEVTGHHHGSCFTVKWIDSSQGIVVEATHGIHIRALIERDTLKLLGCHEEDGAKDGIPVRDRLQRRGC